MGEPFQKVVRLQLDWQYLWIKRKGSQQAAFSFTCSSMSKLRACKPKTQS